MKLSKIINPQFNTAFQSLLVQQIPIVAGIKLREIYNTLCEKQKAFEDSRDSLIKSLVDKDEDGNLVLEDESKGSYKISVENRTKLNEELNKAFEEEFEIKSVKATDLGDKVTMTLQNLILLEDIVK